MLVPLLTVPPGILSFSVQIGKPPTGHTGDVYSLAFCPDRKTLASGSSGGPVQLWDVATGRQFRRSFTGHTDLVDSVAFSPDGKTLASGSQDNTVRFWNVATGSQLGRPLTGSGIVDSVAFSPDGKTLASGSGGVIRLWDATNRRQIGDLPQSATSVAFSPDGKTLAAGGRDGTVQLWDVAYLVDAIPHLCALTGRSLTRAEWARYVPVGPAYQSICP
jgi:WD40 repeat protein